MPYGKIKVIKTYFGGHFYHKKPLKSFIFELQISKMSFKDQIIAIIKTTPGLSSSEIHERSATEKSYSTTKRMLTKLVNKKLIDKIGNKRGAKYQIGNSYGILHSIDLEKYFEKEIDERAIKATFNFDLIQKDLYQVDILTDSELEELNNLQSRYLENISSLSKGEYSKEIERLAIDLSWKSSQIEGNTYTLLETERLLKEKKTASGKLSNS